MNALIALGIFVIATYSVLALDTWRTELPWRRAMEFKYGPVDWEPLLVVILTLGLKDRVGELIRHRNQRSML